MIDNGRDNEGRFVRGNKCGRGNPHAVAVAKLRSALLAAVSPHDMSEIVCELVERAKDGNISAAGMLIDRVLGPPQPVDLLDRIEELESLLGLK